MHGASVTRSYNKQINRFESLYMSARVAIYTVNLTVSLRFFY